MHVCAPGVKRHRRSISYIEMQFQYTKFILYNRHRTRDCYEIAADGTLAALGMTR
jgi:hypothetical protein